MKKITTIALCCLSTSMLISATFNVNDTSSFRSALENAALNGEDDTIILDKGVYKTTDDGLGTFVFNDDEEQNLTIRSKSGLTRSAVVLSGDESDRVLSLSNKNKTVTFTFKNITIKDGKASGYYATSGGGFYSSRAVVVEDCDIYNNSVEGYLSSGGGFSSYSATVINSNIYNNSSTMGSGGGFSTPTYLSSATVINSNIYNNNSNIHGGGFYSIVATVTNSNIYNNKANRDGGGFFSSATITNSNIYDNEANNGGGFRSTASATVINSNIYGNSSRLYRGGGFQARIATVINSNIYKNSAKNDAGGFFASSSYVINSNFIDNTKTAIDSKGIFVNNIFVGHDVDIDFSGTSKVFNNYIDYTKLEGDIAKVTKKNNFQPNEGTISFENDYQLKSTSFGIDIGLNPTDQAFKDLFTYDFYNKIKEYLKTDIVGNVRVANGIVDLGSFEVGSVKYNPNSGSNDNIPVNNNDDTPNTINSTGNTDSSSSSGGGGAFGYLIPLFALLTFLYRRREKL